MYRNFYSVYPLFNIYTLYNRDIEKSSWIQDMHPSLWKYIDNLFKVIDRKGNVFRTLKYLMENYDKYKYKEYIYHDKEYTNILPIYYISDIKDLDIDYLSTVINVLCISDYKNSKVGWLDTDNNIICFIDKDTAFDFYKKFGFD